jgi:hypothetical protein
MGAWAADDVGDRQGAKDAGITERPGDDDAVEAAREAATRRRRLAIAHFEADRKRGLTFAADEATADALLADFHRRVGDSAAARAFARAGIARGPEGISEPSSHRYPRQAPTSVRWRLRNLMAAWAAQWFQDLSIRLCDEKGLDDQHGGLY